MAKAINTSGKRKSAIARATVKSGVGKVRINKKPLELVDPELARLKIVEPLALADKSLVTKVDIDVIVSGGGIMGQADACRTAIARGLVEYLRVNKPRGSDFKTLESAYRQRDRSLLVNDPRRKMPKKPMGRGARKKRQKSYR
ncbi:MAG: 30S ribosomal protein S9 [Thermoplasmata archaeon]|nr:30S ribosomal protein S9 [Thermoplasmata archaeon]